MRRLTTEEFIEKACKVHGDKFDYSKTEYVNSKTKVIVICRQHGEFEQLPHNHISKMNGCPYCAGKMVDGTNCLQTHYPGIASEWHPFKNTNVFPSDITPSSNKKFWWKCSVFDDHEWLASPKNRVSGTGCPFCVGKKVSWSNCLANLKPEISKLWHPTKNKDLSPLQVTPYSEKRAWFKCPKASDHEWEAYVNNVSKGRGCPYCAGQKVTQSNCLTTTHPSIVKQWHPTKNNITPDDVTFGSMKSVWWQCELVDTHNWKAAPNSRLCRDGVVSDCPFCNESKGEKCIQAHLDSISVSYIREYRFQQSEIRSSRFDFYTKFGLIEYHGEQHYIPYSFRWSGESIVVKERNLLNNLRRDQKKEQYCKDIGIRLLVIPFWDFHCIPEILDDFIAGKSPVITRPPKLVMSHKPTRRKLLEKLKQSSVAKVAL